MAPQGLGVIMKSPCTHGVADTPHREVCDTYLHQMESIASLIIFVVGIPILKLPYSLDVALCILWDTTPTMHLQLWQSFKGVVPRWFVCDT